MGGTSYGGGASRLLDYQIAGFTVLVVHYEAFVDTGQIISCLQEIRKLGMKAGLAINPETEVEALVDFKDFADQFLLLSVHPGFQGRHFLPKTIDRVKQLRSLVPHAILEVDGGINSENIGQLAEAGGED